MYKDKFGYIPVPSKLEWKSGKIESLPDFPEKLPGWEHPALLYSLPTTHSVELFEVSGDQQTIRKGIGGFIIHFIGFLFGYRCQFEDWLVDGRVLIKSGSDFSFVSLEDAGICLAQAIKTWSGWQERQQRVAINALFLHNRAWIYMWDWERFQSEYTVLDACYKLANVCYGVKAPRHEDRISKLCARFGLAQDGSHISKIVSLRNDLVHEALWEGGMPGEAWSAESFMAAFRLNRLCARLLFALLNINAEYVSSPWWHRGTRALSLT